MADTNLLRLSPEIAKRARHLADCPTCDTSPLLVSTRHGISYVHCPQCRAHTHHSHSQRAAERQWQVLAMAWDSA